MVAAIARPQHLFSKTCQIRLHPVAHLHLHDSSQVGQGLFDVQVHFILSSQVNGVVWFAMRGDKCSRHTQARSYTAKVVVFHASNETPRSFNPRGLKRLSNRQTIILMP